MNRSIASGPSLVTPQAILSLWPITTPGAPAKLKPPTRKGHSGDTGSHQSETSYQIEGNWIPRWGSSARSGEPDAVRVPATTQLFEPIPGSGAPMAAAASPALARARSRAGRAADRTGDASDAAEGVSPSTMSGWSAG